MKNTVIALVAVLSLAAFSGFTRAEDAKEVKLLGTMVCAKCTLKEADHCQNVLQVKDDNNNTVAYYLVANDLSKKMHSKVCHGPKEGVTVTGTVEEKEGKKWLNASAIDFAAE